MDRLPPVLDLIRVLSLHPGFVEYCKENFDFIEKLLRIGGDGEVHAINGMLTCRIIINLFNRRVSASVLEENYSAIIRGLLSNIYVTDRKNTRAAFVGVLLHFAYCFYIKAYFRSQSTIDAEYYRGQKLKCLTLLIEILKREEDEDIILNICRLIVLFNYLL